MNEEHWKDVDANYFRWRRILTMQLKTGRMTDNHSLREADQQKRALLLRQHRDNPRGHELILMRERTREPREIQSQINWLKLCPPTMILEGKRHDCFFDSWKKYSTGYSQMASQTYFNTARQDFHFLEQTRVAVSFWLQGILPIPHLGFLILKLPASKWTWLRECTGKLNDYDMS